MINFVTPRARERSAERMVLASSFAQQSFLAWSLVISPIFFFAVALTVGYWFMVIWVFYELYALGKLFGNKVIIDRLTQGIVVERRHLLLIHRKRVISFLDIQSVIVQSKSRERHGRYIVFLNVGGNRSDWVKIVDEKADEEGIIGLADEIGEFIGTQSVYLPQP